MSSFDATCPVFVRVFDECSVVFVFVGLDAVSLFPVAQEEESTETEATSFLQRMD